jgi:translation initiation factor RLI1
LKPAIKPQYVDRIAQKIKGKVGEYILKKDVLKLS